jgi:transcriptional regulator with XRE-family HTH domain
VSALEQALGQRVRELRRRHFGPRGKLLFAQRLGISADEYERYERGALPPGDILVRMCEATGEDLQWLLTGVASRGTVVISGTRGRHQNLLARLARLLDERPELAAPVEAFIDLIARSPGPHPETVAALEMPAVAGLIPIYEPDSVPLQLPLSGEGGPLSLDRMRDALDAAPRRAVRVAEPALRYAPEAFQEAELLSITSADGRTLDCVCSTGIARYFPDAFGVRLTDDAMQPMFAAGDAVLVAAGLDAKVGRPALCRTDAEPAVRCRIWLGEEQGTVHLGRLGDGGAERISRDKLRWSLEILYRLARAA